MLMKRVEKDLSDVAKDPVTDKDVRDYIKVEQFKKENEMKRMEAELTKHKFDNRYRNQNSPHISKTMRSDNSERGSQSPR